MLGIFIPNYGAMLIFGIFVYPVVILLTYLGGLFIPYVYHVYMSSSWGYLYPTAMMLTFGLFIAYFSHVYPTGMMLIFQG